MSLESRIIELMPEFSKGQKKIAQFILEHGEKAAYMTALALGNCVGVSESTVVRFAERLGFDGYPEFQRALQELMKSKLTSVQRIELSASRINENEVLKSVLLSDMDKIKQTLEQIDEQTFNRVVDEIVGANSKFSCAC